MSYKIDADFETYSEVDLKASGAFRYAEDPSTEALILAFSIGDSPVKGVDLTQPRDVVTRELSPLFDAIQKGLPFCAHNVQFERLIWTKVCKWFPITPHENQWDCTAARARALAIPGSLDGAAEAIGLGITKDPRGKELIELFSKPHKKTGVRIYPHERPEDFQDFIKYCIQDVEVERKLDKILPPLQDVEREAFALDYQINDRGLPVNTELVNKAATFVEEYSEDLVKRAISISGYRPTQREKTMDYLASRGYPVPNLQAPTVETLAKKEGLPPDLVELLDLRIELSRAGTKKLKAIQNTVSHDNRIRGSFLFSAASTRRWSSTGVQVHNLQKPEAAEANPEAVFQLLMTDPMLLKDLFDRPLTVLAQSIRGFFESTKKLLVADYASVEPRGLAWMADEEWILEAYRNKQDLYKIMASRVYGVPIEQVDAFLRFMGKQLVLGCMGAETLVVTHRGAVPITHVLPDDKLWDGVEWVSHKGVICQGEQDTIEVHGLRLTPDHKVFTGEDEKIRADEVNWDQALDFGTLPEPLEVSDNCRLYRELFRYDPLTGELFHRERGLHLFDGNQRLCDWWNKEFAGEKAGRLHPGNLYTQVGALGRNRPYKHNIIWEMCYGSPPNGQVDHINRDNQNDRLFNLRLSTPRQNSINGSKRLQNTSGFIGVRKKRKKWLAEIGDGTGGGKIGLGVYDTPEEAARVRDRKVYELHGVYATLNFPIEDRKVYDIAHAGPRNRFTVLTSEGPVVLSNCGYGMGPPRFIETCAKFGTTLTLEDSTEAVYGYRNSVRNVTKFWGQLEAACIKAVKEWKTLRVGRLRFRPETLPNGFRVLFVDMPSGTIAYPKPSVGKELWGGQIRDKFEFYTPLGSGWVKTDTFGGSLAENVVQALTRDILRDGLLAANRAGHFVIGHVHDEAIAEGQGTKDELEDFEWHLSNSSEWADGFPIATEGYIHHRYKK